MIEAFSGSPESQTGPLDFWSSINGGILDFYKSTIELGSNNFFQLFKDGEEVKTPTIEWVNSQRNYGYYEIKNILLESSSSVTFDLFVLVRNSDDAFLDELIEISQIDESLTKCCWNYQEGDFVYNQYIWSENSLAYRLIEYRDEPTVLHEIIDSVSFKIDQAERGGQED